jgi:phosphatidylserine/phosphatidylglycerophosphate/cardiolipin synthase-like enzyme
MSRAAYKVLAKLSSAQLEALAKRMRRLGELPLGSELVGMFGAEAARELETSLRELETAGLSAAQLSLACELAAEMQRQERVARPELVWTGPESDRSVLRDTDMVVRELLQHAQRSVLVTSYNLDDKDHVFQATFSELIKTMERVPEVRVILVMDVHHSATQRKRRESATSVVQGASDRLGKLWGKHERPSVYYDPRALVINAKTRPVHHAKCIVVDNKEAFVTSANFTQAAHKRNIEAGVLLRDAHLAQQLQAQFEGLIERAWLARLPGW